MGLTAWIQGRMSRMTKWFAGRLWLLGWSHVFRRLSGAAKDAERFCFLSPFALEFGAFVRPACVIWLGWVVCPVAPCYAKIA